MGHARLRPLDAGGVTLHPDGQLGGWQELNRAATIDHCIAAGGERQPRQPPPPR